MRPFFEPELMETAEFIYKGKKFNARKETAQGEVYFGIKIFRCAHFELGVAEPG